MNFSSPVEVPTMRMLTDAPRSRPLLRVKRSVTTLLALALVGLAPTSVAGQAFDEEIRVLEVQVPVNVTGRDGEPVRGLTAEHFRVYDEGTQEKITGFEVIDLEVMQPDASATVSRLPAAARRHFLLLFDLTFANPNSILRARSAARQMVLSSLHPSDLVAVMTFSLEQGPQLVVTFTPDRAQVARAIDTLGASPLLDPLAKRDPLRFVVDLPERAQATVSASPGVGEFSDLVAPSSKDHLQRHLEFLARGFDRGERAYARSRILGWSRSLAEVAKVLDSVPGRKHIIYLSEGFDSRLLVGRDDMLEEGRSRRDQLDIQHGRAWLVDSDERYGHTGLQLEVFRMLEEFKRADTVIQAVDIGGLRADRSTRDITRSLGHDSLFYMANETGGELFKDANRLDEQLDRVLSRSTLTYLLSFQPSEIEWDGAYRRLRVRVDAPRGTQISHRSGYYAPRPFDQLNPFERELLAAGPIAAGEERRDLDLALLVAPFRATPTMAYTPVILEIGGRKLLEGHRGDRLSLEIYAYVTNERGEMQDFFAQQISLDLSQAREAVRRTGVKYYGHLQLRPGDYLVRALVRNATTGRTGLMVYRLEVPEWHQGSPALLPPFFVEPQGRWILIRDRQEDGRGMVVYPFIVNGEPFIPAARPPLRPAQRTVVCLMAYNLGAGDVPLEMTVLAANGSPVDGGRILDVERTVTGIEGLDRFVATFQPRGLQPGEYTLELAATDPATGITHVTTAPFMVVN